MFLIDSHCHLNKIHNNKSQNKILKTLKEAYKKKIKMILSVATSIKDFQDMQILYKNIPYNILYSCGIHPLYCCKKKTLIKN